RFGQQLDGGGRPSIFQSSGKRRAIEDRLIHTLQIGYGRRQCLASLLGHDAGREREGDHYRQNLREASHLTTRARSSCFLSAAFRNCFHVTGSSLQTFSGISAASGCLL